MKVVHGLLLPFVFGLMLLVQPASTLPAYDCRTMTDQELWNFVGNTFTLEASPQAPNVVYGTIYVIDNVYRAFNVDRRYNGGESFESFIQRHAVVFNQMLQQGNALIEDYLKLYPRARIGGAVIRRIIIVGDTAFVRVPDDSDGIWWFRDYAPTASGYWNADKAIDYGLLHEWGHAIAWLPDTYSLDLDYSTASTSALSAAHETYWSKSHTSTSEVSIERGDLGNSTLQPRTQTVIPQPLLDIPTTWRQYYPGWGWGPVPQGIMGSIAEGVGIDQYNMTQIARRIKNGTLHDSWLWQREASWGYPPKLSSDIPLKVVYEFDATRYKNLRVDVYQTDYPDVYPSAERTFHKLTPDGARLDIHGQVRIDNLFYDPGTPPLSDSYTYREMYPAARAVLLFKVYDDQNKLVGFTWSDIRLVNLAAWMGVNREATVTLPLADPTSSAPDQFVWSYSIRGTGVLSPPIFVPLVKS